MAYSRTNGNAKRNDATSPSLSRFSVGCMQLSPRSSGLATDAAYSVCALLSARHLRQIAIVTSDGEGEEHVLELRSGADVVHDERTAVDEAVGNEADMCEAARQAPRHDIAGT